MQVLSKSSEQHHRILRTIAQNLRSWNIKVLKIKAIYHTLNMLHTEGQNYVAECWLPVSEQSTVQMVLNRSSVSYHYTVQMVLNMLTLRIGVYDLV